MQANTIAGGASGIAFLLSQVLFLPAESLTWPRVVVICVCAAALAALGYFSRAIHPVAAEPAAGPPAKLPGDLVTPPPPPPAPKVQP